VKSQAKKPNILVIMTDDVGVWNTSAFHRGMMGGRTWLDECYFRGRLEDGAHDLSICEP
jgi:arylsulfatase A-like enzyme